MSTDDPNSGLRRFYSSQAEVMLAQYRNINDLLGPTTHHTHPGTHCEVLLRQCIRDYIPPHWSADKGFILGRCSRFETDTHSPEIDILIHDENIARPIFRLEDFVIVEPRAVIGMIQVKKSFKGNNQLRKAVANIVDAKQHLVDLLRDRDSNVFSHFFCFSAAIAFDEEMSVQALENCLCDLQLKYKTLERETDKPWNSSIRVLPDLVGTLSGDLAIAHKGAERQEYLVFKNQADNDNLAVQFLLWRLAGSHPHFYHGRSNFPFPKELRPVAVFWVPKQNEPVASFWEPKPDEPSTTA